MKQKFKLLSAVIIAGSIMDTNGIYTYSLIVDGQTMETKKMIKTK